MATRIRLARRGRAGRPFYHIVVADSRSPRDGRYIESIGSYNPMTDPATVELDFEKAVDWVMKGAQPSDTARSILSKQGVMLKKHLLVGVRKGALTEEQAEAKFQTWLKDKEAQLLTAKEQTEKEKADARQKQLDIEKEQKEARLAEIEKRKAAEKLAAQPAEEAQEESEEAPAEEAAPEAAEVEAAAPEAPAAEEVKEEAKAEEAAEAPAEEAPKAEEPKAEAPKEEAKEEAPAEEEDKKKEE